MSQPQYKEYKKSDPEKAFVWSHFLRADNGTTGKCKHCQKILKCVGGSTSGLRAHLRSVHAMIQNKSSTSSSSESHVLRPSVPTPTCTKTTTGDIDDATGPSSSKKAKLTDYFSSENSTSNVIARMVSLDGIPFRLFCTSKDLRALMQKSGHKVPNSPNTVREIVLNKAKDIKNGLKREISDLKALGHKFSISFDEWTSLSNKRFININLHFLSKSNKNVFTNLGLARIAGSMPAEDCIELLNDRLNDFNVSLYNDVVAMATDGCSLMKKVGRLLPYCIHQVCLAHGLQLAILEVIYNPEAASTSELLEIPEEPVQQAQQQISHDSSNSDTDNDNDSNTNENEDAGLDIIFEPPLHQPCDLKHNQDLIKRVRKVAKLFKKSPVKNSILQSHVRQELGHELQMMLDCKTRWSSLANMLGRFIKLKTAISKALIDIKADVSFTSEDFRNIKDLSECLDLFKNTVEVLCRRDATLLTADAALNFALNTLSEYKTPLSLKLAEALSRRIKERRLVHASLLFYLQNPGMYFVMNENSDTFRKPSPEETMDIMIDLIERLEQKPHYSVERHATATRNEDIDEEIEVTSEPKSVKVRIQAAIDNTLKGNASSATPGMEKDDLKRMLHIEMAMFDNGGDRGKYLTLIYRYLLTVVPTSVEAERAFSAAGILCSRFRSSLSDNSLDALCFLRSHFKLSERVNS